MFEHNYEIDYQGLKWDYSVPLSKLMAYLQETSIRHSQEVGLTMDWFYEQKSGWVICSWDIEILDKVKWPETLRVVTCPSMFKGVMAHRGFEIFSGDRLISRASSKWVYTNRVKRRPVKVSEEMKNMYGDLKPLPVETAFAVTKIQDKEPIAQRSVAVTRRDTDTNRHTNNISYIQWVTDMLSDEQYNNSFIKKAQIAYHRECVMGDCVNICLYNDENKFYATISKEELLAEIYFEM